MVDGPIPVSARAQKTLAEIGLTFLRGYPVCRATTQIERLRRGGYVRVVDELAYITDAGRALLRSAVTEQEGEK